MRIRVPRHASKLLISVSASVSSSVHDIVRPDAPWEENPGMTNSEIGHSMMCLGMHEEGMRLLHARANIHDIVWITS